jgi:hypothetical protein
LDAHVGILSNYEVFHILSEHCNERTRDDKLKKKKKKKTSTTPQNLIEIEDNTRDYIKEYASSITLSSEKVKEFLRQLAQYQLTLNERVQILNLIPTTLVEIHLVTGFDLLTFRLLQIAVRD